MMPETAQLPTFDNTVHASADKAQENPQDRVFGFLLLTTLLTTTGVWIYFLARIFWAAAVWIMS